jgi:hypothetical protein
VFEWERVDIPMINTWAQRMKDGNYDHRKGHGRILMGVDGLPVCMLLTIVDDYFIHGPTKRKCHWFFSAFMDYMVRLDLDRNLWNLATTGLGHG